MTTKKTTVETKPSERGKTYWESRDYIKEATRGNLEKADLVIVPFEGFREHKGPVFPQGTTELYRFLQEQSKGRLRPEICVEDDQYVEVALHGATVVVATFVVSRVVLPLAISLLAGYLISKLRSRSASTSVRITVIVDDKAGTQEVQYEGPASEFEKGIQVTFAEIDERKER